jgi:threonine dehydrogenase-like Zn-dependent dehydrogenase
VTDAPEPVPGRGELLVDGIAVGVCGTDHEIANGGTVNANLDHYRAAAEALASADLEWLRRLITRRVPLEQALDAFERHDDDVKVVVDL